MSNANKTFTIINGFRVIDLTGRTFGRLEAIEPISKDSTGQTRWLCKCSCGNEAHVLACRLTSGTTRSCGCLRNESLAKYRKSGAGEKRDGHTRHPLYSSWKNMTNRCHNPDHVGYKNYGARGIAVCDRWRNDFMAFVEDMGVRPYKHTIDRRDNNGDYTPENCRWVTQDVQNMNKRTNRHNKAKYAPRQRPVYAPVQPQML